MDCCVPPFWSCCQFTIISETSEERLGILHSVLDCYLYRMFLSFNSKCPNHSRSVVQAIELVLAVAELGTISSSLSGGH